MKHPPKKTTKRKNTRAPHRPGGRRAGLLRHISCPAGRLAGAYRRQCAKRPSYYLIGGAASLRLLLAELEVLAPLNDELLLLLALLAFQAEGDLLRGLRLFVEHRLGLSSVTHLFAIITTLALGEGGGLASLVLCDLWWAGASVSCNVRDRGMAMHGGDREMGE